jgi:hypothetical protein
MWPKKSHGRLELAILIAVPVIATLGFGIHASFEAQEAHEKARLLSAKEQVASEARAVTDGFTRQLKWIREQSQSFKQLHALSGSTLQAPPRLPEPLMAWAEVEKGSAQQMAGSTGEFTGMLQRLISRVRWDVIQKNGTSVIALERNDQLGLAFSGGIAGNATLVIVESRQLAPIVAQGSRAFLVNALGRVLVHSQPSYLGSDFSRTQIFSSQIKPLLVPTHGKSRAAENESDPTLLRAIDQADVVAASARSEFPGLVWGVERMHGRSTVSGWREKLGQAFVVGGILAVLFAGWLLIAYRRVAGRGGHAGKADYTYDDEDSRILAASLDATNGANVPRFAPAAELRSEPSLEPTTQISAEAASAISQLSEITESKNELREELRASQQALRGVREELALVENFEKDSLRLKDPKAVATRLAQATSQLCGSPVLYFTFHDGLGAAILQADAGFAPGTAPVGMSFPLDDRWVKYIQAIEKRGETASLSEYEPLTKILLARMGVAHFEAWAVTGYGHLGRQAGLSRLLGVLVILQAGVDSVSRHDSLNRLMRATGLIYENALLSR